MLYEEVDEGEGVAATQRRLVLVDVTDATPGQVLVFDPTGRWAPRTLAADGSGPDYSAEVADLLQRVGELEENRVTVYVGNDQDGFEPVTGLWVNTETGDVSAAVEGP